jgi:hypothetical protein|nr:MAG TPA: hypothetical protein [Caudoviricetes sp.]
MAKIISSPADLIQVARSRKAETLILLPHAYETAHSLRRFGSQAYIVASAPSIAGKIGILSLEGAMETEDDLEVFRSLSPVCGMKDGRIVNTTGHILPFEDGELEKRPPSTPVERYCGNYRLQRANNEWYYYLETDTIEQQACLAYIHGLAVLNSSVGGVK